MITVLLNLETVERKGKREKMDYLENEKTFLNEIKSFFQREKSFFFFEGLSLVEKIKNSEHKL